MVAKVLTRKGLYVVHYAISILLPCWDMLVGDVYAVFFSSLTRMREL